MKIKTFTAANMPDALALVRQHYGSSAVILHTRQYKQGGFLGFGCKNIVEVTAGHGKHVGQIRREQQAQRQSKTKSSPRLTQAQRRQQQLAAQSYMQSTAAGLPSGKGVLPVVGSNTPTPLSTQRIATEPDQAPTAGELIRQTYAAAQAQLRQPQISNPDNTPNTLATRSASTPATHPGQTGQLAAEMQSVKHLVSQMMYQQKMRLIDQPGDLASQKDLPDKLVGQYLSLLEQELAEELAGQVIEQVKGQLSLKELSSEKCVRSALQVALADLVPTDDASGEFHKKPVDGRPRTIALIGPTGVGKTTTIAKLAASMKLKQKLKVSLVTLDTYRIAAVDQLQTYAQIIGIPLHVCARPDEMVEVLARCQDSDVILIDTAGRSQNDDPKLQQLNSFMRAARPHEVHLVLSSTCSQKVLLDMVARFSTIQTDRIIFTKLDEAVTFGVLFNVARKVDKRLSYITTGQEVPHHIEAPTPSRLASLVLGQQLETSLSYGIGLGKGSRGAGDRGSGGGREAVVSTASGASGVSGGRKTTYRSKKAASVKRAIASEGYAGGEKKK